MRSTRPATRADRRGTTLVELLAALALLGLLFLGARSLLIHLGDSNERLAQAAHRGDARGAGERVLRSLLRRATVGADSAHRFIADQTHAEFDTACDTGSGWSEDCRSLIAIILRHDSTVIVRLVPGVEAETLFVHRGLASFRYFDPAAPDDTWVHGWGTNIALPAVVALVAGVDTTVFRVGGR